MTDIFSELRDMWTAHDPAPAGLADDVLAVLAATQIVEEFALLELVSELERPLGVRSASATATLQFRDSDHDVLVRLSHTDDGARVDGWVAPASPGIVNLVVGGRTFTSALSPEGRFEFARIPAGRALLWLKTDGTETSPRGWTTPGFEIPSDT